MHNFELHPYCTLFSACTEEELHALTDDIRRNGLLEPIVLLDKKILDGRNRYQACRELGIEPDTVEFTGDDPLAFVISKNLHRRHLNESQRAMVAEKLANLPPHRPTKGDKRANLPTYSQGEAAKALNVSERQVKKAAKLRREAPPEIIEQVEQGKIRIHSALPKPKEKPQPKSRKKTIAQDKDIAADFAEVYKQWLKDPAGKETPTPEQNEEGILKIPLPLDHFAMYCTFSKVFGRESKEIRNRVISEIEALAGAIHNLND